uniref:Uncharacterized protein n=1 Tax=Lotus japonicus TaxID=34305 RepID=I3S195_LOTJA|nr:unknown [Lotus japonicus]
MGFLLLKNGECKCTMSCLRTSSCCGTSVRFLLLKNGESKCAMSCLRTSSCNLIYFFFSLYMGYSTPYGILYTCF